MSQIRKKSAFWFWAKILGQNNEGILPHTFLSSQTKNGEKIFFSFFTLKMCNLVPPQLTSNWSVGMKIMQLILCYCGQRSANFLWKVLEAPSSFEIFKFLTVRDRKLKFWQNDALMSTLGQIFCSTRRLVENFTRRLVECTRRLVKCTRRLVKSFYYTRHLIQFSTRHLVAEKWPHRSSFENVIKKFETFLDTKTMIICSL